jgi:hypothetical protein
LRWGKVDPTQRRSIRQMQPARMANDRTEESHIIEAEEYRSRWGARASNPLEGAQASSVGSTPASSGLSPFAVIRLFPKIPARDQRINERINELGARPWDLRRAFSEAKSSRRHSLHYGLEDPEPCGLPAGLGQSA